MIGLVLVWRIKRDEVYRSVFEIDAAPVTPGGNVSAAARMTVLDRFVRLFPSCYRTHLI